MLESIFVSAAIVGALVSFVTVLVMLLEGVTD